METLTNNEVTNQTMIWSIDQAHSSVHFSVKHMVIAKAKGSFGSYKITAETNGLNFENAKIDLEIDVNSINTGVADRDGGQS